MKKRIVIIAIFIAMLAISYPVLDWIDKRQEIAKESEKDRELANNIWFSSLYGTSDKFLCFISNYFDILISKKSYPTQDDLKEINHIDLSTAKLYPYEIYHKKDNSSFLFICKLRFNNIFGIGARENVLAVYITPLNDIDSPAGSYSSILSAKYLPDPSSMIATYMRSNNDFDHFWNSQRSFFEKAYEVTCYNERGSSSRFLDPLFKTHFSELAVKLKSNAKLLNDLNDHEAQGLEPRK